MAKNIYRRCTMCDGMYPSGGYRTHAEVHDPVRPSLAGGRTIPRSGRHAQVHELLAAGMKQTAIASMLGLSRQRVHQIVHTPADGIRYRGEQHNAGLRIHRKKED